MMMMVGEGGRNWFYFAIAETFATLVVVTV
jgi:hypothetical protein